MRLGIMLFLNPLSRYSQCLIMLTREIVTHRQHFGFIDKFHIGGGTKFSHGIRENILFDKQIGFFSHFFELFRVGRYNLILFPCSHNGLEVF